MTIDELTKIELPTICKTSKFLSPEYTARFLSSRVYENSDYPGGSAKYQLDDIDNISEWISKNALYKVREGMDNQNHNDFSYIFLGENGALCAIDDKNNFNKSLRNTQDINNITYQRTITIRSQPILKDIPKEIMTVLNLLGYDRIE